MAKKNDAKNNETKDKGTMTEIVFSHEPQSQGVVFRMGGEKGIARFSPYVWLSYCDYEIGGRTVKLDFSRYDVVLRAAENHSLDKFFAAVAKNDCSGVAEKDGALTIEIIEKEEG
jgi:hypothetical protein